MPNDNDKPFLQLSDAIRALAELSAQVPEDSSKLEVDGERRDFENLRRREDLLTEEVGVRVKNLKQDVALRKTYSNRIFWLIVAWVSGLGVLLTAQFFAARMGLERFPKETMIALLATTSVNVIGLLHIVARYVFPSGNSESDNS